MKNRFAILSLLLLLLGLVVVVQSFLIVNDARLLRESRVRTDKLLADFSSLEKSFRSVKASFDSVESDGRSCLATLKSATAALNKSTADYKAENALVQTAQKQTRDCIAGWMKDRGY